MSYALYLLRHDLFWAAVIGLGLGGALSAVTVIPSRGRHPDRIRAGKWTRVFLALSLSVIGAAGALLFVGFDRFVYPEWLITGLVVLVLSAAAARFPRGAGIPLFLLIVVASVVVVYSLRGWTPVRTETEIATLRPLSVSQTDSTVEVDGPAGSIAFPDVVSLPSSSAVVSVDRLVVSRYLFLSGAEERIRFDRRTLLSAAGDRTPSGEAPGAATAGPELLLRIGAATVSVETSDAFPLRLLRPFRVVAAPGGVVRVAEQRSQE